MPRPHRIQLAGGFYHVTQRGTNGLAIFFDDDDRRFFLGLLALTVRRQAWGLDAYCLMTNHFHLVIGTPQANISAGMQRLSGIYGQRFNERHQRFGHVFQGRFGSTMIESDEYLEGARAYVRDKGAFANQPPRPVATSLA